MEVVDFGIRGVELAYTLLDNYDTLVLVDAVSRGRPPGTVYLIEPDLTNTSPVKVLAFARTLDAQPIHTLLVGCEPATFGGSEDYAEMPMGLSEPVRAAVDEAVKLIVSLIY